MNTRMIVPAILSVIMLGAPVLAQTTSPSSEQSQRHDERVKKPVSMTLAEQCTSLEKQLDDAIKTNEKAPKVNDAKAMRTEGGGLCAAGRHSEGIAKLEKALDDLNVKVKY